METASVDLIYLDPPFNSSKHYAAPIGSKSADAAFKDTWTLEDVDLVWHGELEDENPAVYQVIQAARSVAGKGMMSYLIYMAVRLVEMHRIMKDTASVYLHCDDAASHYLKMIMDSIFGRKNFLNEIVWRRMTGGHNDAKRYGRVGDRILFYRKGNTFTWNMVLVPYSDGYKDKAYRNKDARGIFHKGDLTGPGSTKGSSGKPWRGIDPKSRCWSIPKALPSWFSKPLDWDTMTSQAKLDLLDEEGLIYHPPKGGMPRYKRYLDLMKGVPVSDIWTDINNLQSNQKEKTGYPTQKPLALLKRIINASSNPSDLVLDPFCGCATACVAAEDENRNWIGIDISSVAHSLILKRFKDELNIFNPTIIHRTDIPQRAGVKRSREIKNILYGVQDGYCNGCNNHFRVRNFTIDHRVPVSQGGQDIDTNLQLLCGSCNSTKGDRTMEYLLASLKAIGEQWNPKPKYYTG